MIAKGLLGFGGKLVGKEFRLTWGNLGLELQELHAPGLKRLRLFHANVWGGGNFRILNVENFVDKVAPGMSYEQAKMSIQKQIDEMKVLEVKKYGTDPKHMQYAVNTNEEMLSALKVEPEGMDAISVEAKGFTIESKWASFKAYSPESDMGTSGDPSYAVIESKSAGAARKLYKLLRQNPDALKGVSWDAFSSWLDRNGVAYEYHFSQWH